MAMRAEYDDFVKRNPGDGGRFAKAYGYNQADVDAMLGGGAGQQYTPPTNNGGIVSTPYQAPKGGGSQAPPPSPTPYQAPSGGGTQAPIPEPIIIPGGGIGLPYNPQWNGGTQAPVSSGGIISTPYVPTLNSGTQAPKTPFTGDRGPGNPSDEQIEDFLRRNPGDEHRIAEGFADDGFGHLNDTEDGSVPPSTGTPPPPIAQAGPAAPAAPAPPAAPSPLELQTQQALSELIARSQQPISAQDSQLAPAANAYGRASNRAVERQRNAAAERANATGTLGAGSFDNELMQIEANAGAGQADYEAQLVLGEMDKRREDLTQGIALAMQSGQFDKAQALQERLAMLQAEIQQQQLALQTELGRGGLDLQRGDLDLRRVLGMGGLDLQRELGRGGLDLQRQGLDLNRLLGLGDLDVRNKSLTQQGQLGRGDLGLRLLQSLMQNDQFFSQLGLSASQIQALLNQNAMAQLLGGF